MRYSSGNFSGLLRTVSLTRFVSTPYNAATSASAITFSCLITTILLRTSENSAESETLRQLQFSGNLWSKFSTVIHCFRRERYDTKTKNGRKEGKNLFLYVIADLFEGNALIELGRAFFTFWNEVETDTTNVLLGTEILEIVNLFALDFEFQKAEPLQSNFVAHLEMATDSFCHRHHQTFKHTTTNGHSSGCSFFKKLATLNRLIVNGYGLVFTKSWKLWLRFFLYSVPHICYILMQRYIIF